MSRIDFIAVGQECQGGIVRSFVAYDWGLLNGDRGHHLVVVDMDITFNAGQPPGCVKKALYDRDKARAYKKTGLGDVLSNLPQQAWRCDMNEHWHALRYHLQKEVAFWFPNPNRKQRQLYLDPDTWKLLCSRKGLRQHHRQIHRDIDGGMLKAFFKIWKFARQADEIMDEWQKARHLLWQ